MLILALLFLFLLLLLLLLQLLQSWSLDLRVSQHLLDTSVLTDSLDHTLFYLATIW